MSYIDVSVYVCVCVRYWTWGDTDDTDGLLYKITIWIAEEGEQYFGCLRFLPIFYL